MKRILIILAKENESWIIAKIARRLESELSLLGFTVTISDSHQAGFDIIFWSLYRNVPTDHFPDSTCREFFLITHVDDSKKLQICRKLISNGLNPICMSIDSAVRISQLLGLKENIPSILIGSDLGLKSQPRLRVLMSSIIYPDGRKNESWLGNGLPADIINNVEFQFIGRGWAPTTESILNHGGIASFEQNDSIEDNSYESSLNKFRQADLVVYTGFDEGSLSVLDAYLLGVKVLVSAQGFHLELGLNEDCLFRNKAEFYERLTKIVRNHIQMHEIRSRFTWEATAKSIASIFIHNSDSIFIHPNPKTKWVRPHLAKVSLFLIIKRLIRGYKHMLYRLNNRA